MSPNFPRHELCESSRDIITSGPGLWVCAPFPEPREFSPRRGGHRHRSQLPAMEQRREEQRGARGGVILGPGEHEFKRRLT